MWAYTSQCVCQFVRPSDVSIGRAAGSWLISGGLSLLWFVPNYWRAICLSPEEWGRQLLTLWSYLCASARGDSGRAEGHGYRTPMEPLDVLFPPASSWAVRRVVSPSVRQASWTLMRGDEGPFAPTGWFILDVLAVLRARLLQSLYWFVSWMIYTVT